MKKTAVIILMLVFVCAAKIYAQKPAVVTSNDPGWQKIGEITASFKMQDESIVVLGADEFDAIRLKVTDAPINIERLQVFYESGDMEEIDVRNELQAGSETRDIKLEHPTRDIQKVAFTYKTLPNYNGDKAHVELWGLKKAGVDHTDAYREDKDNDIDRADNDAERAAEKTENKIENAAENTKEDVKDAAKDVDKETQTVEEGVNESVAIVGAELKDKVYVDKVGPNNEIIYMDRHSKYYYIDKKGNKIFILKSQMKDKPKKDKD